MLQFAAHFLAEIQKKCIFFAKKIKAEMKVRRIIWALPLLCLACSNYEMDYLSTSQ